MTDFDRIYKDINYAENIYRAFNSTIESYLHDYKNNPDFLAIFDKIRNHPLVKREKINEMLLFSKYVKSIYNSIYLNGIQIKEEWNNWLFGSKDNIVKLHEYINTINIETSPEYTLSFIKTIINGFDERSKDLEFSKDIVGAFREMIYNILDKIPFYQAFRLLGINRLSPQHKHIHKQMWADHFLINDYFEQHVEKNNNILYNDIINLYIANATTKNELVEKKIDIMIREIKKDKKHINHHDLQIDIFLNRILHSVWKQEGRSQYSTEQVMEDMSRSLLRSLVGKFINSKSTIFISSKYAISILNIYMDFINGTAYKGAISLVKKCLTDLQGDELYNFKKETLKMFILFYSSKEQLIKQVIKTVDPGFEILRTEFIDIITLISFIDSQYLNGGQLVKEKFLMFLSEENLLLDRVNNYTMSIVETFKSSRIANSSQRTLGDLEPKYPRYSRSIIDSIIWRSLVKQYNIGVENGV